jgi:hypothetical protein
MPIQPKQEAEGPEPRGFGAHSRGLSGEYAHEQGWGLNLEQRKRESGQSQNTDGGTDYDYGAQDFGDQPVNTRLAPGAAGRSQNRVAKPGKTQE